MKTFEIILLGEHVRIQRGTVLTLLSPVHEKACLEDKKLLREQGDHPTSELGEKLMLHHELYVDTTKLSGRNIAARCLFFSPAPFFFILLIPDCLCFFSPSLGV